MPGEIEFVRRLRSDRFPQDWIANRLHTQLGHGVKIGHPSPVPGVACLVTELVANAQQSALDPAPQLERLSRDGHAAEAGSVADLMEKIIRTCAFRLFI